MILPPPPHQGTSGNVCRHLHCRSWSWPCGHLGMLMNAQQCTEPHPQQRVIRPQMSAVLRLRNHADPLHPLARKPATWNLQGDPRGLGPPGWGCSFPNRPQSKRTADSQRPNRRESKHSAEDQPVLPFYLNSKFLFNEGPRPPKRFPKM